MTALSDEQVEAGQDLLRRAIRDPFFRLEDQERPGPDWFAFLRDPFPLSSFRMSAFEGLGTTVIPTTWPLERILLRVLEDEGWRGWTEPESPPAFRLIGNLCARRRELGEATGRFFESCLVTEQDDQYRFRIAFGLQSLIEPEVMVEYDDDGTLTAGWTEYEMIGRQLVARIEARDATTPGTPEAEAAQDGLDDFLKEISAIRGRGRRPEMDKAVLKALYRESADLLGIVSPVLDTPPSDRTREFLEQLGVDDTQEQEAWALRLAVPVLSSRELTAVGKYGDDDWLTPRRLGILILARRLDLEASYVARRVVGADESEGFKDNGYRFEI